MSLHSMIFGHSMALLWTVCLEMWLYVNDFQLVIYMPVSEFWNKTALLHNSYMCHMKTAHVYHMISPLAPENA